MRSRIGVLAEPREHKFHGLGQLLIVAPNYGLRKPLTQLYSGFPTSVDVVTDSVSPTLPAVSIGMPTAAGATFYVDISVGWSASD